ncbi:MarR family winged helix-turn-helix transcriptional regulator [Clostridium felsineum]|uniref:Uncharacterized protein n=1 Tax=Clostridium felsineum TaxID=36839 RepID=A0A1S8M9H1_9CLOT|nr:MarR family transcriptional regulator [Clostridium felsineum]MCR3757621.1 MarR family transcriptional regulator [Clostridium felsineum]URZ08443.1 hypothetical protein CLROS_038250 [Clostridium felsineum]URZ13474.1 hypothetical protein CROST_042400 [Clostridium felsineum]URZ14555.1 hypothetical protein CLFE_005520 [Clostridium felsineum DSM 794]
MKDNEALIQQIERIIHKYTQMEKRRRFYGTNISLTYAEIHTIDTIGSNDGINITQLALLKGITKGAVSQMIYKLIDKGLVIKEASPKSDVEVVLKLTESGKKAYNAHLEFHRKKNEVMCDRLLNDMTEESYIKLKRGMESFERMLDRLSELDKDNN